MRLYRNAPNFPYIPPDEACFRCGAKQDDAQAYCPSCGKVNSVFRVPGYVSDERCAAHPEAKAIGFCCLCTLPICDQCNNKERQHFSFTAGFAELYFCKFCCEDSAELERSYLSKQHCVAHIDRAAVAFCKSCKKPICEECNMAKTTYYACADEGHTEQSHTCAACRETAVRSDEERRLVRKKSETGFILTRLIRRLFS